VKYLRQAGDKAAARSANREAVALLEQALAILGGLEETPETLAEEADVRLVLGPALIALGGPASIEIERCYLRAREASERLRDASRLYPALWGLWYTHYTQGHYSIGRELGERLLAVAEDGNDSGLLLEAHHALWATLAAMGEHVASLAYLERGAALYDPERHGSQAFLYGGHDAGACSQYHLANTRWYLGYPDGALAPLRDSRAVAERLNHPLTTAIMLSFSALVHYHRGDRDAARDAAARLVDLATSHPFPAWIEDGNVLLACLEVEEGGDGRQLSRSYESLTRRSGRSAWRNVISLTRLAGACATVGNVELGLAALAGIPDEHQSTVYAPELERVRGELRRRSGEPEEATRCFRRAIAIARQRAERSLELRAVMSLARLLADRGQRNEARAVLAPVYGWFTEGFDTADLKAARALLDTLA
jgi:tetratricopeptide (TPR) repeat protein